MSALLDMTREFLEGPAVVRGGDHAGERVAVVERIKAQALHRKGAVEGKIDHPRLRSDLYGYLRRII